jgi:hypothetical protein
MPQGNSLGLGFAGPGGPAFIPGSLFVSADLGQPIPIIGPIIRIG